MKYRERRAPCQQDTLYAGELQPDCDVLHAEVHALRSDGGYVRGAAAGVLPPLEYVL